MIDKKNIELAIQDRPNLDTLKEETAEALACYFAGKRLDEYVTPFSANEETDKLAWRKTATIQNHDNFVKEIAELYLEGILRAGAPERSVDDSEEIAEYLCCDYSDWFWHEVAPFMLLLPELYIHVTYPEAQGEIETKKDQKELQGEPYPVVIFPHFVKNFRANYKGELIWISIENEDGTISIFDKKGFVQIELEKEGYKIKKDYGLHGFDTVPFVQVAWRWNHALGGLPKIGYAMMHDVIKKTLGGMQVKSQLLEASHFHLRLKLIASPGTIQNIQKSGLGNASIIPEEAAEAEGGANTRYLNTPNVEIDTLDKIVHERIPASIYRTARLKDHSVQQTQVSGVAKMLDLIPEEGVLRSLCGFFQKTETGILKFLYPEAKEVVVEYPTVFNSLTAAEAVAQLTTLGSSNPLPQSNYANQLVAYNIYTALLPEATEEDKNSIWEEIETAEATEAEAPAPAKEAVVKQDEPMQDMPNKTV